MARLIFLLVLIDVNLARMDPRGSIVMLWVVVGEYKGTDARDRETVGEGFVKRSVIFKRHLGNKLMNCNQLN